MVCLDYDDEFYDQITEGAVRSAHKIIPQVFNIFGKPNSVVDIGCGRGAWLSVFQELGVEDIIGVDGSYVLDEGELLIPRDRFIPADLETELIYSGFHQGVFDLAISLEVAEHLHGLSADRFVNDLCNMSDNILFSAAVPGQNGVNHINEQWPSYWVPKFAARGYQCSSNFRFDFWHDDEIENWYRQNILLFSKYPHEIHDNTEYFTGPQILDVIHYNNWNGKI